MESTRRARGAWDETFSVGVEELDDQHRTLFRLLDSLAEVLDAGGSSRAVAGGLDVLLGDCAAHFAAEELYLARIEYPGRVTQSVQHRLFTHRLVQLRDRVRSGEEGFTEEALEGLESWLRGHILGLDQEYARFVRDKG